MPRGLTYVLTVLLLAVSALHGGVAAQEGGSASAASLALGPNVPTRATGSLPFFYDLYTFRGERGRTEIIASFAVPAERLREEREGGGVRYRFDVTLVLSDTARHAVSRTDDSVYVQVPRRLAGEHLLHTHVELDAPPSSTTLQRVLMYDATTPGVGQLYGAPFTIPDYRGGSLMLSDVALGLPGATRGWERGDVTLALLPTSQFPQSSFDVYYEVYNLPAGHDYTTDISVERIDEDADETRPVHARFTGRSEADSADALPELRRVEASLDEGRYLLTVTVTDRTTGESARRTRLFQVRGWGPGITLVPALPSARELRAGP
jgi:hypothetical protein